MTQWTEQDYQALSKRVARKFDVDACVQTAVFVGEPETLWLHDDWHTIMELCVKHGVICRHFSQMAVADNLSKSSPKRSYYADHDNNPSLAERIARLLALEECE